MHPDVSLGHVITTQALEIRIGARTLLSDPTLRIDSGDRIGLVGRNGAGKTTPTKIPAGAGQPSARPATDRKRAV